MTHCCSRRVLFQTAVEEVAAAVGTADADPARAVGPTIDAVRDLAADRDRLRALVLALAERVAAQSELLSRRSEK